MGLSVVRQGKRRPIKKRSQSKRKQSKRKQSKGGSPGRRWERRPTLFLVL